VSSVVNPFSQALLQSQDTDDAVAQRTPRAVPQIDIEEPLTRPTTTAEALELPHGTSLASQAADAQFVAKIPIAFARRHCLLGLAGSDDHLPVAIPGLEQMDQLEAMGRLLGRPLPLMTRIVKGFSDLLLQYGWVLLLSLVAIVGGLAIALRQIRVRRVWHRLQLRLPLVGALIRQQSIVLAVILPYLEADSVN
jgi:hypothetical protein